MTDLVRAALADVQDLPRHVEARAILLSGACGVFGSPGAWAVRNEAPGGAVVVLVGAPEERVVRAALCDRAGRELLAPAELEGTLRGWFPDWRHEGAVLYELEGSPAEVARDEDVRVLTASDSLAHLETELREEMESARANRDVHALFADDLPVSFAYSYWRTEGLFDISIDTAETHRRRGFAARAARALIHAELELGRRPVWGAMDSNEASHALARRLGFVPCDRLWSAAPVS